jgi:hypothetical protein
VDFSLPEEIFSTFSDQIPTFEGNSPFLAAFGTLFPRKSPVFPSFQENKSPGGTGCQKQKMTG